MPKLVSELELRQRISLKLEEIGGTMPDADGGHIRLVLREDMRDPARRDRWFVLDQETEEVTRERLSLEDYGRELGVLDGDEAMGR